VSQKNKQGCITYLKDGVLNNDEVSRYIGLGDVPPVVGIESKLSQTKYGDWLLFIYNLTKNAPHYQLSWDQALAATPAQALLTNLDQLFLKQITPQQFSASMNQTIAS
jgi:raffinose/stachyose/melibiose transport system substrate-binding protein